MKILIAEDNATSRIILESVLKKWGYTVISTGAGDEALAVMKTTDSPHLLILDWMMPGMNGIEVCRKVREESSENPAYIIMLTSMNSKQDIVNGLQAGADDYLTKPFDNGELQARVRVGERVLQLQSTLVDKVNDLQAALDEIKTLRGIVTICMHCHKILNDNESWERMEKYVEGHSEAQFSHGICPDCLEKHYPEE